MKRSDHITYYRIMFWKEGVLFTDAGSLIITTSFPYCPPSNPCVLGPASCLFRIFEICKVHPIERLHICHDMFSNLMINIEGQVELAYSSVHNLPLWMQPVAHDFFHRRIKRLSYLEKERRLRSGRRRRQLSNNTLPVDIPGSVAVSFSVVEDGSILTATPAHPSMTTTPSIASSVISYKSTCSSIPPIGKTKCGCHIYYDTPWNGVCNLCNKFCVRTVPRKVNSPTHSKYIIEPNITENAEGSDSSTSETDSDSDYEDNPLAENDEDLMMIMTKKKKKKKRQNNQPLEYVNARDTYHLRTKRIDIAGTWRDHTREEFAYFEVAHRLLYSKRNVLANNNIWLNPPPVWYHRRKKSLHSYPAKKVILTLIQFAQDECSASTRIGWDTGLASLEKNSTTRFCYSLLMAISVQGMSDKSVVPHINSLINNTAIDLNLAMLSCAHSVSKLLRRTSKWVKNSVIVADLASYILKKYDGIPPVEFTFYTGLNGFAHKTSSLLFWGWREEAVCLPVDLHVKKYCQLFKWSSQSASRDEISFQAQIWLDKDHFISLNDALGAIGQFVASQSTKFGRKNLPDQTKVQILLDAARKRNLTSVYDLMILIMKTCPPC